LEKLHEGKGATPRRGAAVDPHWNKRLHNFAQRGFTFAEILNKS